MLAGTRPGEEVELARVRRIVCAGATPNDAERYGEHWLTSFLDFCERSGIGTLRVRPDGGYALALTDPLPSCEQAWERVQASWPPLDQG
jgi:hypothetical protein